MAAPTPRPGHPLWWAPRACGPPTHAQPCTPSGCPPSPTPGRGRPSPRPGHPLGCKSCRMTGVPRAGLGCGRPCPPRAICRAPRRLPAACPSASAACPVARTPPVHCAPGRGATLAHCPAPPTACPEHSPTVLHDLLQILAHAHTWPSTGRLEREWRRGWGVPNITRMTQPGAPRSALPRNPLVLMHWITLIPSDHTTLTCTDTDTLSLRSMPQNVRTIHNPPHRVVLAPLHSDVSRCPHSYKRESQQS